MTVSPIAKCVLSSFISGGMELTIGGEQSRLSNEAREAMAELICEGLIDRKLTDDRRACGITYMLTEKGRKTDRRVSAAYLRKHGKFSLTVPNDI